MLSPEKQNKVISQKYRSWNRRRKSIARPTKEFYENKQSIIKCNVDPENFPGSPFGRVLLGFVVGFFPLFFLFNIERDVIFNNVS